MQPDSTAKALLAAVGPETRSATFERLTTVYPALIDLPASLRRRVEHAAAPRTWPAGHRLFDDGGTCRCHPLLLAGTVRVSKTSPDGREIVLYRFAPGDSCVLTTVGLLGNAVYPAHAVAETAVTMVSLPQPLFLDLLLEAPSFRGFAFASLSTRLADLMALVDEVVFRRVDERLAARLLRDGTATAATHRRLADDLGTSREVVSRILENFQQAGLIRLGRRRIEVLDRAGLDARLR